MKQSKQLIIGVFALAIVTLALTPLVGAEGSTSTNSGSESTSSTTSGKQTETETPSTETERSTTTMDDTARTDDIAKHRAEIQAKVQSIRETDKSHLSDVRKKVCQNRQENINQIIKKRSEQGAKQLAVFESISSRVQAFVKDKNLVIANYDQLVATINDKQAAAQAAIDANNAITFSCDTASDSKPVEVPRTTIDAVRDALQAYRTAIKDLIVQVKASADKTESSTPSTTSTGVNQ